MLQGNPYPRRAAPGGQAHVFGSEEESEWRQRGCNSQARCSMTGQCSWAEPRCPPRGRVGVPACLWAGLVDKRRGRCRLSTLGHGPRQPPGRALSWRADPGQTLWRPFKLLPQSHLQTDTWKFRVCTELTAAKVTGGDEQLGA